MSHHYLNENYTLIGKDENLGIAIPSRFYPPKADVNDYAIIIDLDTYNYYEGVSCRPISIIKNGIEKETLLKNVRVWNNHKWDKEKLTRF